ncbi:hypothetical protein ACH5RR_013755 [Cinchona calisaya]|uniref:GATA-type domain-containing protein n=1 Tax=Cinchona calisaya TaxID=153742 RepID=A0ABD3A2D0_9GENT
MMHNNRCCGGYYSHGNMCSCGLFHNQTNAFSMIFSMPNHTDKVPFDETAEMYSFASSSSSPSWSSSSSPVDCTLSLGTPSTRSTSNDTEKRRSSCMSNFCWDILQSKPKPSHKSSRGNNGNSNSGGGEGILARRCANCDTTSTPLWRNGPKGPKSLCNACGIRFKKEERRATVAGATNGTTSTTSNGAPGVVDSQHVQLSSSWVHQSQSQKIPPYLSSAYFNGNDHQFSLMEDDDDDRESDNAIPFLSWRLNVTDRPSLVHDFTRY